MRLPGRFSFADARGPQFTLAGAQPRAAAATVVVAAADGCTIADAADALSSLFGAGSPDVYACDPPLCFPDPPGASAAPPGDDTAHQLWLAEQLCAALRAVPTLVLIVPASRSSGGHGANAALPLSSAPCVAAIAAVLRAGCEPRVACTPAAVAEAHTALLSRAVRPGDLLGDAFAAVGPALPPGAVADVAAWATSSMLRRCRFDMAELQAAGCGASLQAAFCLANLGVATVTAERRATDAERAEALGQLRTALCLFAQAPAPDAADGTQRRDAVLACLDALPSALPAPERADDVAQGAAQPQSHGVGADIAKIVALAVLVSLCADVATLVAALPWLTAALLRAGAVALRLVAAAALLLHGAHAAVALAEAPRLRPEPAQAEKVPHAAPVALKTPLAAESPPPSTPLATPSAPSSPRATTLLRQAMQTPQTPQTPPRLRDDDDVSVSPGAALAAAAFGVALKPALAARGPQATRAADETAAKRAADEAAKRVAAAEAAATAARWAAAVRAATRPSPVPFMRTVVHL